MIKLILILMIAFTACGSVKEGQKVSNTDSVRTSANYSKEKQDSIKAGLLNGGLPQCIMNKITSFKKMEKHEQPQKVVEYLYKEKKVYYILMPCCDFFNEVYDDKCNLLGSPDGGIIGKGDGKLPGFFKKATNEKIVWEAKN